MLPLEARVRNLVQPASPLEMLKEPVLTPGIYEADSLIQALQASSDLSKRSGLPVDVCLNAHNYEHSLNFSPDLFRNFWDKVLIITDHIEGFEPRGQGEMIEGRVGKIMTITELDNGVPHGTIDLNITGTRQSTIKLIQAALGELPLNWTYRVNQRYEDESRRLKTRTLSLPLGSHPREIAVRA